MAVAIPERVAKTQYINRGRHVIGYSLKCGSSAIRQHTAHAPTMGQAEALKEKERGRNVWLFVRHPLDRLASAYVFFTRKCNSCIRTILNESGADHDIVLGHNRVDLKEWYDVARRYYNAHWEPQYDYHTTPEGVLVPNVLRPLEALDTLRCERINASGKDPWETYYTDEFREEMEELYANDIWLYEEAKRQWDNAHNARPECFS